MHLLIPFAAAQGDAAIAALADAQLPQLRRLLATLSLCDTDSGAADSLSPPHERALAHALGLPVRDGRIPWAAWHVRSTDPVAAQLPCAWLTLCHWQASQGRISAHDPQQLAVTEQESQALLHAMQPWFAEDGIALREVAPGRWLAHGEAFRDLACASLERVIGRQIDAWMPAGPQARTLDRLQNEMQMLLYTHALNDAREARGQRTINSFWVSGAGALPPGWQPAPPEPEQIVQAQGLRDPALRNDWSAWAQAWSELDQGPVVQALQLTQQGAPVTLTLCGERSARRYELRARPLARRVAEFFRPPTLAQLLQDP